MLDKTFYLEELNLEVNSYELKMFRSQHDETQLEAYLKKYARKHTENKVNKIYLVRSVKTKQLAAWFGLKAATLPYNDVDDSFLIPAIELTHFAVDERFKKADASSDKMRTGEFIFWNYILPIVKNVSAQVACKAMFVFAIDTPKLIKYYKETLRFKEISDTDEKQFFEYAAPDYDEGCRFLYYSL